MAALGPAAALVAIAMGPQPGAARALGARLPPSAAPAAGWDRRPAPAPGQLRTRVLPACFPCLTEWAPSAAAVPKGRPVHAVQVLGPRVMCVLQHKSTIDRVLAPRICAPLHPSRPRTPMRHAPGSAQPPEKSPGRVEPRVAGGGGAEPPGWGGAFHGRAVRQRLGEMRRGAAAAAAIVLGAAACYCLWRRAAGGRRGQRAAAGAARGPPADNIPPASAHTTDADALQKLIHLLQATDDPLIQEQALITLSNSAAFSVNQDIIRNLDGLSVIGRMLSDCVPKVKEKALNALNNLSMNIKNQEEIQVYITQVCRSVESAPLNSDLQLAGLRLLTNMSVTSDYHHKLISSVPCFLSLLSEGTERTQIQVLKVLVNLSANPDMTRHLLRAQVPSLLLLFDNCMNRDILLRALAFAANLKKNVNNEDVTMIQDQYSEDSIFSTLCRDSASFAQKLASLLHHPDTEVKEQVVRILTQ
ncbi:armadillo repeat-containing protein 10 [Rhynochetos jubatus]